MAPPASPLRDYALMPLATRLRACLARLPVGPLAALLLGGAVTFYCLAMPGDLVARLLEASGVARLLAIGAPPYGPPARALIAFLVGTFSFLAVWGGFALADRRLLRAHDEAAAEPVIVAPAAAPPHRPVLAMAAVRDILELTDPLPPLTPPAPAASVAAATPRPSAAPTRPGPDDPIPVLMARLEAGLARRAARERAAPRADQAAPTGTNDWPDSRVRAALDQLRQLARAR